MFIWLIMYYVISKIDFRFYNNYLDNIHKNENLTEHKSKKFDFSDSNNEKMNFNLDLKSILFKFEEINVNINNKKDDIKIDKENLARLTEKFYRMHVHKDMKIRGTGLGLAIAKQIIMHHRGNLTVTSTTYNGTTFTIYLPVKQK